ncbi:hypothetical protein [Chryseobacterium sp. MP_3.2]|uniref:hypothetical protein n=1 Tax=Chryseobacterium sp. MP_3.2 TaxID=3071712 RepID=UPI002E0BB093|nr:antitoxin component YwqK of YwqJK toxin-antitoxin module [Chryseobacterium sp. MP_3.2]
MRIKNFIFLIPIFIFSSTLFSQNKAENVVYVVDNITVRENPERENEINNDDIDKVNVINNKDSLAKYGLEKFDKAIFFFTKEFKNRPTENKKIPSTKQMEMKKGNVWYYNNQIYTGKFIDYYYSGRIQGEGFLKNGNLNGLTKKYFQNGKVSLERNYVSSIPNGLDKEYFKDGSLKHKGEFVNGKEDGIWEMYFPNGKLKQQTNFQNGKMIDESKTYYSNGKIARTEKIVNDKILPDPNFAELDRQMNKANESYKNKNENSATKILSKVIEDYPNYKDVYFSRGTILLNQMKFDEAILDFDKAIEIEPYYDSAIANRAFASIRKYELGVNRKLSGNSEITVLAEKKDIEIPENEKSKICSDLKMAIFLGDRNDMNYEALDKYCAKK